MTLEWFDKLLHGNNAIGITEDIVIFNDYELYNHRTKEEKHYTNIYDLAEDNPDVKKIILETETFYNKLDGGRGASSGAMGGGFNHASDGGGGNNKQLYNAILNVGLDRGGNSINDVLSRFRERYGTADHEYGIAVDANGYVHQHIEGGAHSVSVTGGKDMTIIHNHPNGGNFSDSDLLSVARTQERGVIATSSNPTTTATYRFEKTSHFDAKGFEKALKNAQWPAKYSYSKGADWWLRRNAKVYGYRYSASGVPKT